MNTKFALKMPAANPGVKFAIIKPSYGCNQPSAVDAQSNRPA